MSGDLPHSGLPRHVVLSGASANTIDINDFWQCYDVARGMLPKKYTAGAPD